MRQVRRSVAVATVIPVALVAVLFVVAAADAAEGQLQITYPLEGTLFPPESVAPTFVWEDGTGNAHRWDVVVRDDTGGDLLRASVDAPRWRPSEESWKQIKRGSV